jgi:3',5'-cyclic AMP phosphodiesterase CpdA
MNPMSRFLMITDSHLGADPMGFYQQTPYPERFDAIIDALRGWMDLTGGADFVLHAGDLIDFTTPELIDHAAESLGRLGVPVHLALGNHDLTTLDALEMWMSRAPHLLGGEGSGGNFVVRSGDVSVYVLVTQWCETPNYWEEELDPHLTDAQWDWLGSQVGSDSGRCPIIMTHSQVLPVGTDQSGLGYPLHDSTEGYKASFDAFCAKCPRIQSILGGHSHLNSHIPRGNVHYIGGSSLVETPFEFKCFEFDENEPGPARALRMTTESLLDLAPDMLTPADYDATRPYVQGRPQDRGF